MIAPVYSDFLVFWDTLAKADTCPELKAAWDRIVEHSETIEFEGLNELWNFYLERLGELEEKLRFGRRQRQSEHSKQSRKGQTSCGRDPREMTERNNKEDR
ncbi:hypothetical protein ACSYAY_01325 [Leptospirillum ferriphilum]|uniref:Uncharacterized protein n=1 Tax=Leptospirillum ferriphilum TaxID=178606 RepID=A0A1V3SWP9_9BACT|nr:hypothetical protein [Leptospirillum ferriphilum]OOH72754.1 hypothetical protein BOX24_05035 [Leptospirillum ferriphilum]